MRPYQRFLAEVGDVMCRLIGVQPAYLGLDKQLYR
jgi:hypothetical protein